MTDAERLQRLLDVSNAEQWMDSEDQAAAWLRSQKERVPLSRRQVMKKLREFIDNEASIDVGRVGMNAREWTPRLQMDGLRTDLTDHELEALRLEELRVLLGLLLRGEALVSVSVAVGASDGEETVSGQFPDVVLYLAMRLLADSGLHIRMCEAPEAGEPGHPNTFDRTCAGVFITQRSGKYCCNACKTRAQHPQWQKHLKQAARKATRKGKQ